MRRFIQHAVEFLKREDGPAAVEYAIMLSLIVIVCVGAVAILGSNASAKFARVAGSIGS